MSLLRRIERNQSVQQTPTPQEPTPVAGDSPGDRSSSRLEELRLRRPVAPPVRERYLDLKQRIQNKLISELDPQMDLSNSEEVRRTIEDTFDTLLQQENIILNRSERQRLFAQVVAEILGLGPIEPLLADDTITDVLVNGPGKVYIERDGVVEPTDVVFEDEDHLLRIIDRIVSPLGRRIDESSPYVDARLPDGSRVNAIIPPLSLTGPTLSIRKFATIPITAQKLIEFGTITPEGLEFLKACVQGLINTVISGGTGSGKTTTLNVLSAYIPNKERIITIENAAELQLQQEHVVRLETRPPNVEGKGEVTMRDLVINSLRMRPDRIVVGECRGSEALDMLQAMNTGHDGSLTTAHSNTPRDTLARLETMVLMAGMDLPLRAIREQIASAIQLIVHEERMRDGSRKITNITEVQGMEGDVIVMQDLFVFEQTGLESGRVIGTLRPTGIRPKFIEQIEAANIHLPPSIFGAGRRF
jgi:pilus assembly protein CpaF